MDYRIPVEKLLDTAIAMLSPDCAVLSFECFANESSGCEKVMIPAFTDGIDSCSINMYCLFSRELIQLISSVL